MALKRKRRIMLAIVLTLTLIGCIGWTAVDLQRHIDLQEQRLAQLQAEKAALLEEQERLKAELAKMDDPEHIAKLARKHYFMTYPGEILFIPTHGQKEANP